MTPRRLRKGWYGNSKRSPGNYDRWVERMNRQIKAELAAERQEVDHGDHE